MNYVFIDSSDINIINFSEVLEDSVNTLRYNNDETKTFIKYSGSKASFVGDRTEYTYDQTLTILATDEWQDE